MHTFPQALSNATVAAYFLYGIEAGLFEPDCAKEWAYGIVEVLDEPPIEIIEVAAANTRDDSVSGLTALSKGGDLAAAGALLLSAIGRELEAGGLALRGAISIAMQVARSTSLPQNVYYTFDGLDDELALAQNGTYSTVEVVRGHAIEELSRFGNSGECAI